MIRVGLFVDVAVGQRRKEGDDVIFFLLRKLQVAKLPFIHVGWIFGGRPARRLFAGIPRLAGRKRITGVIEMDDFL